MEHAEKNGNNVVILDTAGRLHIDEGMMEELQTILSLGAGGVSKRVVRETGWIERANNPKYPLEYIQAADRLANGKKKLLFPKK